MALKYMTPPPGRTTLEHAFWSLPKAVGDCLIWPRLRRTKGDYGLLTVGDARVYAHRVAWEMTNGPIPDGLHVLHRCDTPPCVKPAHLFLGTPADNTRDKIAKGRQPRGSRFGRSGLDEGDVAEILRRLRYGAAQSELARVYGVSQNTISCIARRETWRHVPEPLVDGGAE